MRTTNRAKIGMVAPSAHHIGRTKSAPRSKTVNVSQNIFRSMHQVYLERLKTGATFDLALLIFP